MDIGNWVGVIADGAAIFTAIVAVWVSVRFIWKEHKRRIEIETYLSLERQMDETDGKNGLRSIPHLMSNLAMTEEQVYAAAFSSKVVRTWTVTDENNRAAELMFQYEPKAAQIRANERSSTERWISRARRTKT